MLRLYGLRLLVALLTFGVGVAAASLLGFGRSKPFGKGARLYAPVAVGTAAREVPPPPAPPRSCNFKISGGVLNGKALSLPAPLYPQPARTAGASGTVVIEVLIDESGKVAEARAVSGHPLLRPAALVAARQAKFSPSKLSGEPVKVRGTISYVFTLPK